MLATEQAVTATSPAAVTARLRVVIGPSRVCSDVKLREPARCRSAISANGGKFPVNGGNGATEVRGACSERQAFSRATRGSEREAFSRATRGFVARRL